MNGLNLQVQEQEVSAKVGEMSGFVPREYSVGYELPCSYDISIALGGFCSAGHGAFQSLLGALLGLQELNSDVPLQEGSRTLAESYYLEPNRLCCYREVLTGSESPAYERF